MKTSKKNLSLYLCLVLCMSLFVSCRGPKGDPGIPGRDGNANVKSETVVTTAADWKWDADACNWYLDLEWNAIDYDMVDYGAVLVYMESPGDFYAWHQLPLTLYPDAQYSATLETVYYDNALTIFWTNSDLQRHENPCNFYNTNLEFKLVLIDAKVFSDYKDEDLSDYKTIMNLFDVVEAENLFEISKEAF